MAKKTRHRGAQTRFCSCQINGAQTFSTDCRRSSLSLAWLQTATTAATRCNFSIAAADESGRISVPTSQSAVCILIFICAFGCENRFSICHTEYKKKIFFEKRAKCNFSLSFFFWQFSQKCDFEYSLFYGLLSLNWMRFSLHFLGFSAPAALVFFFFRFYVIILYT